MYSVYCVHRLQGAWNQFLIITFRDITKIKMTGIFVYVMKVREANN